MCARPADLGRVWSLARVALKNEPGPRRRGRGPGRVESRRVGSVPAAEVLGEEREVEDVGEAVEETADDAADAVEDTAEEAADAVEDATN